MTDLDWYPIDPGLDDKGAYSALRSFPRASELKPVPLGEGKVDFNRWQQLESAQSLRVSFRLGVGAMFKGDFKHEGHSFTFSGVWCEEEIIDGEPNGGLIFGTRWGAGIRIHVRTSEISASASVNLTTLAADSELGMIQADYTIETIGVTDSSLLQRLPVPGRLDTASAQAFYAAADLVKKLEGTSGLVAVPFEIYAPTTYFQTPVFNALSIAFAASRIAKGVSYQVAMNEASRLTDRKISPIKVHELYARWGAHLDGRPPSADLQQKARKFLDV